MSETVVESTSFGNSTVFVKGSTSFNKYFSVDSGKWERTSGSSGGPYIVLIDPTTGLPNKVIDRKIRVSSTPYLFSISEGEVPNHSSWKRLGHNPLVINVEEDIWPIGGKYVFPTTPMQMEIVSSSGLDHATGSGIRTVRVGYLDGDYVSHTETIQLSGSTVVPTVATNIYRVNNIRAVTVGSLGKSGGQIDVRHLSDTPIYRSMEASHTRGHSLIYTVPSGSTVYITGINMSTSATAAGHYAVFTLRANWDDAIDQKVNFMQGIFQLGLQDQALHIELSSPIKILPTCDLVMSVLGDASNSNLNIFSSVRGWIESE